MYKFLSVSKQSHPVLALKTKKPYQTKLLSSVKYVTSSLHVSCFSD